MHITLRQLKLFKAVAQHLSFTRAAAELCLTQPAVSIQIKQLEEQVNTPLFEQIGKRIFLTDAGRVLQQACEDIFARIEMLEKSLNELQGAIKGTLKLSVVTNSTYFMPHLCSAFMKRYPEVLIRLNVSNRVSILERLANNEDDLIVMGRVPEELNVIAQPFLENPLVVVAPSNHPLVGQKNIPLARLAEETFLLREVGSGTRLTMERCFASHDLEIKEGIVLGSCEAIKQGILAGLGLSILPRHTLNLELALGIIQILDVAEFPLRRQWYVAYLCDKSLSLVARTFLEFLAVHTHEVLLQLSLAFGEASGK